MSEKLFNEKGNMPVRAIVAGVAFLAILAAGVVAYEQDRNAPETDTGPVVAKPGPSVLLQGSHHQEIEQFGANTFTDYTHASGLIQALPQGAKVDVDCVAKGPVAAAPTAKGTWYHIENPKQYAGYYVAANTFENGDTTGPLDTQPAVDPKVPACPAQ